MAQRFVYLPDLDHVGVNEVAVKFNWFPGFSVSQKRKSIASLHQAASKAGHDNLLEISSKSEEEAGVNASAFNLSFQTKSQNRKVSVESAFQGSKAFAFAGPFHDLYDKSARDAKREVRSRQNGQLVNFDFFGKVFPIQPRTFFYDWLYIKTLHQNEALAKALCRFSGFTDIEFNPEKSINCQAFSAALYVSLVQCGLCGSVLESEDKFMETLLPFYKEREKNRLQQHSLI